jgi:hypothetical protein
MSRFRNLNTRRTLCAYRNQNRGCRQSYRWRTSRGHVKKTTSLRHDSQVRSNDVATQHSDTLDAKPSTKKARLALNDYVNESNRLMASQARALDERKAATQQCRICRIALRAAGKAVVKVGKLVQLPDTVMETLTVPGSVSDNRLLAHMQALYDRVLPYKDAFEGQGLPPDVLANLTNGIQALQAARSAHAATIQDAASVDVALTDNQDKASATIHALESVVATTTPINQDLLTKLKVARRVGPRSTDPAAAAPGGTTPAPSAPSPSPSTATSSTATSSTVPPSTTTPDPGKVTNGS